MIMVLQLGPAAATVPEIKTTSLKQRAYGHVSIWYAVELRSQFGDQTGKRTCSL